MINKEKILSSINLIDDLISYSEKVESDNTNQVKRYMVKLMEDLEKNISEMKK